MPRGRGKRIPLKEERIIDKYALQGIQDKATALKIWEDLREKENINVSYSHIALVVSKIKKQLTAKKAENNIEYKSEPQKSRRTFITPAEKLYLARMKVIEMREKGFTNKEIADEFYVQESDVYDFFLKRRYINPEQYREIVYKSTKGATVEELAQEYSLNVDTVKKILSAKQKVISSDIEQDGETQQEFDLNVARNFIKFINTLMTCKSIKTDEAEKLDQQRQDIFHELEMKELTQEEKLAMLDRIAEISRQRRDAKDYNQIFAPVIEFLNDEGNMNLIKIFANRVAEAVNKLKDTSTRVYFLRGE